MESVEADSSHGPSLLEEVDNYGLFVTVPREIKPTCNDPERSCDGDILFKCQEPGCSSEFFSSEELENS